VLTADELRLIRDVVKGHCKPGKPNVVIGSVEPDTMVTYYDMVHRIEETIEEVERECA
jgi:hypothetical protein